MANMRNGLETWLKKECVDTGHELSELNLLLVLIPAQLVSHNFETAQFMLSKAEDKLRQANEKGIMTNDVYHTALDNVRDLVKRHGTELQPSPPFEKYNEFLNELEVRLLEKVVECQCGKSAKPNNAKHGTVDDISTMYASGDKIKVGDNIFDVGLKQSGKVIDLTGSAEYGTIIMVNMTEPVIRTWQNPDGSTGQMVIAEAGPRAYTPADWKRRIVRA